MVPKRVFSALTVRRLATTAAQLREREELVGLGLQNRLVNLSQASATRTTVEPFRVAVLGSHSADFAVAFRAVRAAGATVAPVDPNMYSVEELMALLAEAQVHLGVFSDQAAADAAGEALRRLGKPMAVADDLAFEGSVSEPSVAGDEVEVKGASPSMMLFAHQESNFPRAAEVPGEAMATRLEEAASAWRFVEGDLVLSLGLTAGENASVIDALEAPLMAGSTVQMTPCESVWDLWSALETTMASVVFLDSKWCWRLVQSYESLAVSVREILQQRAGTKQWRSFVALAPPGTVLSEELSQRWEEIFNCSLTWHFSCPEVGSLYTVHKSEGKCASNLEWHTAPGGDLCVRGAGLFSQYRGRPRSTKEAFDQDGFFRTGHRAVNVEADTLLPLPSLADQDLEQEVDRHLTRTPNVRRYPQMQPDWTIKKVPIRVYTYWKANWGGILPTKKHNPGNEVYRGKYK